MKQDNQNLFFSQISIWVKISFFLCAQISTLIFSIFWKISILGQISIFWKLSILAKNRFLPKFPFWTKFRFSPKNFLPNFIDPKNWPGVRFGINIGLFARRLYLAPIVHCCTRIVIASLCLVQ